MSKYKENVCIPHLTKYTKIQMDLHVAKQIKYANDYIRNILHINIWMSEYKFIFEDSSLLESVLWQISTDKPLGSNNLLGLLHPQGGGVMLLQKLTKYSLLDMV